jgi:hypothetical protein
MNAIVCLPREIPKDYLTGSLAKATCHAIAIAKAEALSEA